MFKIFPRYLIPLKDMNFDYTLTLSHDFKRADLMLKGSYPYSISYAVTFAITNCNNFNIFATNKDRHNRT